MKPFKIHFVDLNSTPIFKQLQLEEALLRADRQNWCLINQGSNPAIVLGISSSIETHIHLEHLAKTPLSLIRRFSGGGTVVIDEDTLLITLICNHSDVPFPCYPKNILKFAESLLLNAFKGLPFHLIDHDFAIGEKKCGGNALYITKERFVYHTSLLWNFKKKWMDLLKLPPKMPDYRKKRSHNTFLCSLKDYFCHPNELFFPFIKTLEQSFYLIPSSKKLANKALFLPHRKSTLIHKI